MLNFNDYIESEAGEKKIPLYVKKIADRIEEKFLLNIDIPRMLIITMPPRSLKTTIASKYLPEWITKKFPNKTIGLRSYSGYITNINIERLSESTKNKVYNTHYAHAGLKPDVLIIDDYIKGPEGIRFMTEKYEELSSYIYYSLNPNPFVLIMASRSAKNDIVGRILEHIKNSHLHIYMNNFLIDYINVPAFQYGYKNIWSLGQTFWPEKYSNTALFSIKNAIGEELFETLYQGNPKITYLNAS